MKKILISIISFIILTQADAQNQYDNVLQEIEKNNTSLIAYKQQLEAQKLENRTGIFLENPEIEFAYLWGDPSAIGSRKDFGISQTFEFPSTYINKNKLAKLENINAESTFKSERMNLLLSAKQLCIELIYYYLIEEEYSKRHVNAKNIAESYKIRLDKGDANIIENNKAQLNLKTVENELDKIKAERLAILSELKSMNGGKDINVDIRSFQTANLPNSFEEWYNKAESKSPALQFLKGQIEINQQQIKLSRSSSLPKITTGYLSEKTLDEGFKGFSIGASIPLWENKNSIKRAKAQERASSYALEDAKLQFYNKLQTQFNKANAINETAIKYRMAIKEYNNETFLKKALDLGEISLLEYLLETEYYYEMVQKSIETDKELELIMADLYSVDL